MKLRTSLIIASGLVLGGIGLAPLVAQVLPQPGPPVPIACAYNAAPVTLTDGQAGWVQCTNAGKVQVDATVSATASITGFPGASPTTGTPISVTTGGVTGTLPSGAVVVASNVGTTNLAYCKLGATATTSDQPLAPNGGWFAFTVGGATQLTCITGTSTTTVNMVGGSGLPTGTGGGGGGSSGGGGAITAASGSYASGALSSGSVASGAFASGALASGSVASGAFASGSIGSGAMVDLGAIADAAATAGSTGSVNAKLRLATTQLAAINTTLGTPMQSTGGTVAATQSGTWNITNVSGTVSLPTGAATSANQSTANSSLASIDTKVGSAIPAGTNLIGFTSSDVCASSNKVNFPVSFQTTTLTQQIAASGSNKVYICSMSFIASAATVFSVVTGTGTNCGTGTTALLGTTSATHGLSLAANGGMTYGSGSGSVSVTGAGGEVCLVQSGSGDLVGNIAYVYGP